MGGELEQLGGPWLPGTAEYRREYTENGDPDIGLGTVPTASQVLDGVIEAYVYKLHKNKQAPNEKEWYALYGIMRHGVLHEAEPDYTPSPNWVSVGYYATEMSLQIGLHGGSGVVYDQGPLSTVGQATTSWSIGGSLSVMAGDISGATAGVNAGFSESYSTPAVTTTEATIGPKCRWTIALPAVGFQSDPNPKQPSYAGFQWKFGIIFEIPDASPPTFQILSDIHWQYDWTRGLTHYTRNWSVNELWTPDWAG